MDGEMNIYLVYLKFDVICFCTAAWIAQPVLYSNGPGNLGNMGSNKEIQLECDPKVFLLV